MTHWAVQQHLCRSWLTNGLVEDYEFVMFSAAWRMRLPLKLPLVPKDRKLSQYKSLMMSRFRLLLAWLVMVAVPLQGLGAASMLFCGMGAHHSPAQTAAAQQEQVLSAGNASDQHDHSKHSHAAEVQVKKTTDDASKKPPETAHKCGVCASCCTSVALAESPQLVAFAPVPQAELAEPFVLIHARPSQVPDKPPRA